MIYYVCSFYSATARAEPLLHVWAEMAGIRLSEISHLALTPGNVKLAFLGGFSGTVGENLSGTDSLHPVDCHTVGLPR